MARRLQTRMLGRVEYPDGLGLMALAGRAVREAQPPGTDFLFLLEHPPVVTLGRGAREGHLLAPPEWLAEHGFEVHRTDRGGDVTYHGPGQIVAYPVLDLSDRPDVRRYVAALEEAMIRTCADHGVEAARHPEHRGVWVGRLKIGAVGVHLSRWITSHGLALNVDPELEHFRAIVPCGIADPALGVTSLAEERAARGLPPPQRAAVAERLADRLAEALGRERQDREPELRTVSVVPLGRDGRVLLLRRRPERGGFWQPVTGRIEAGETPEAAARRELCEETGADLPVAPLGYRHAFALEPGLARLAVPGLVVAQETAFAAHLPAGLCCRLSGEHDQAAWFTVRDAKARLEHAGLRRAVELAAGGSPATGGT